MSCGDPISQVRSEQTILRGSLRMSSSFPYTTVRVKFWTAITSNVFGGQSYLNLAHLLILTISLATLSLTNALTEDTPSLSTYWYLN